MDRCFSPTYALARQRFREASRARGGLLESHSIGHVGPDGADLTLDIARFGPTDATRTLVVSSGTHGVEGFAGSAIQLALLETALLPAESEPGDWALVLIHAVNPYGFAWLRRVDENNIDLNRNFLPDDREFPDGAGDYAAFDSLLNPREPPRRVDGFLPRAVWNILRHGLPTLKSVIAGGQYAFPRGLFYGGRARGSSQRVLREHLSRWIGHTDEVIHLDIHTGMGPWGSCRLLSHAPSSSAAGRDLARIFGAEEVETLNPEGLLYDFQGGLLEWCAAHLAAGSYRAVYAEFGTYPVLRVISSLRRENQAHHWGRPEDRSYALAKARLREAFCPSSKRWRRRVAERGLELVRQALPGGARQAAR